MAEQLNVWSGLWQSACSARAYRAAASASTGRMFGYLALLIALATVVSTAAVSTTVAQGIAQFKATRWWENNLPEITIQNGRASSPVAQPFRKQFSGGATVFILDTTGATTGVEAGAPNTVLVTETQLIVRQARRGQTRVHDLSQFPNIVLNQANIEAYLAGVSRWLWPAVGAGMFIWGWILKLFQVLFWSVLGLIVNAASGRRLRYGAIFNIGIFALTVPWAFDLLLLATRWSFRGAGLVSFLLYVGYLVWGILVQPKPSSESASSTPEPIHAS